MNARWRWVVSTVDGEHSDGTFFKRSARKIAVGVADRAPRAGQPSFPGERWSTKVPTWRVERIK